MRHDDYTRHLDLRHNEFQEKGLRELFDSLRTNKGLVSLELRGNPGLKPKLHQLFALELLNKLDQVKKKGFTVDRAWIKRSVYHVTIPWKILSKIKQNRVQTPPEPSRINIQTGMKEFESSMMNITASTKSSIRKGTQHLSKMANMQSPYFSSDLKPKRWMKRDRSNCR
jgi:hypothetical protein